MYVCNTHTQYMYYLSIVIISGVWTTLFPDTTTAGSLVYLQSPLHYLMSIKNMKDDIKYINHNIFYHKCYAVLVEIFYWSTDVFPYKHTTLLQDKGFLEHYRLSKETALSLMEILDRVILGRSVISQTHSWVYNSSLVSDTFISKSTFVFRFFHSWP